MLELWMNSKSGTEKDVLKLNIGQYGELKRERICPRNNGFKAALFWNLISLGQCCTYRMYSTNDNSLIHESFVIYRCYKFPFLRRGDVEIGPCYTSLRWRGKGIYPAVLNIVLQNELDSKGNAYMIIDSSNTSSINGVRKSGFQKIGSLKKSKICKIYSPVKYRD